MKIKKVQWRPNWIRNEWRLCLIRLIFQRGRVGDGRGWSGKFSASIVLEPRDLWLGIYWTKAGFRDWLIYICIIPCVPIRLHFMRSFGGAFA